MKKSYLAGAMAGLFVLGTGSARALTVGQVDDFEDGTTQGWVVNLLGMGTHPAPPQNVSDGGPDGAGDNYLRLTSVGGTDVPGNRLVVINGTQWAGNYTTEGVTGITMSLKNFSDSDLNIRLLFEKVGAFGPTDIATTDAVFLPSGGDWVDVQFDIRPEDLTTLLGTSENALDATVIRIFHSDTATFPPAPIVAQLGVDDIGAVPEPATIAGCLMGLAFLARRRRAKA